MAENKPEEVASTTAPKKEVYSLMWKTYDLTGKTRAQYIKEHPYSVNPIKSISKALVFLLTSL